jgi:hypothetical protein
MIYENEYGKLVLELITPYQHISKIHSKEVPDDCFFDLDTAEQIVLITDNKKSQVAFTEWTKNAKGYLIVHESPSSACVVRIIEMQYNGPEAQEEIERLIPRSDANAFRAAGLI